MPRQNSDQLLGVQFHLRTCPQLFFRLMRLISCSIKLIFLTLQSGDLDLKPSIALSTRLSVALPFRGLPTTARRFIITDQY